jgi:hypothetical protein
MKAVKFLALVLVVVASASARSFDTMDILCGMSNDPTLCGGGYRCVCHGTPQP